MNRRPNASRPGACGTSPARPRPDRRTRRARPRTHRCHAVRVDARKRHPCSTCAHLTIPVSARLGCQRVDGHRLCAVTCPRSAPDHFPAAARWAPNSPTASHSVTGSRSCGNTALHGALSCLHGILAEGHKLNVAPACRQGPLELACKALVRGPEEPDVWYLQVGSRQEGNGSLVIHRSHAAPPAGR